MWEVELNSEINWESIAINKMHKQLEIKICEFNFKTLHNILATGENLFKWQKIPSPACIYCNYHRQTLKHLLWDCTYAETLWEKLSAGMNRNICYKDIIAGVDANHTLNQMLSLIAFIICKKFQNDKDKENPINLDLSLFLKNELIKRQEVYRMCTNKENIFPVLNDIISSIL